MSLNHCKAKTRIFAQTGEKWAQRPRKVGQLVESATKRRLGLPRMWLELQGPVGIGIKRFRKFSTSPANYQHAHKNWSGYRRTAATRIL